MHRHWYTKKRTPYQVGLFERVRHRLARILGEIRGQVLRSRNEVREKEKRRVDENGNKCNTKCMRAQSYQVQRAHGQLHGRAAAVPVVERKKSRARIVIESVDGNVLVL